jgi:hypothetical protein
MSSPEIILGVPEVRFLEKDDSVAATTPTMALTTTASAALTPSKLRLRSNTVKLLTTDVYKIHAAPILYDATKGGYTVGIATPLTAAIPTTAGQVIQFRITNANLAPFVAMVGMLLFLKTGTADPQIYGLQLIDATSDLSAIIYGKPPKRNPYKASALLTAATADDDLGSRVGFKHIERSFTPTTDGVSLFHKKTRATIKPDDQSPYDVFTSGATDIKFKTLNVNNQNLIQATGGNYIEYTDTNGDLIQQAEFDLLTAAALVHGNTAMKLYMPPNSAGETIRMYTGNLDINTADYNEDYKIDAQTSYEFNLQFAGQDRILKQLHTGVLTLRSTP